MQNKELSGKIGRSVLYQGKVFRLVSAEGYTAKLKLPDGKYLFVPIADLEDTRTPLIASAPTITLEDEPIVIEPIHLCHSQKWLQENVRAKQRSGVFKGYTKGGGVRVIWDGRDVSETYHPSFLSRITK